MFCVVRKQVRSVVKKTKRTHRAHQTPARAAVMAGRTCAQAAPALSPANRIGTTVPVDIVWKILATLGLVVMNGYFVATEFCAVTARPTRIRAKAATSALYRVAWSVKQNLGMYLSATQLGVTISSL